MKKILHQTVLNYVMAYKNKIGEFPNAILVPYKVYKDLKHDCDKRNKLKVQVSESINDIIKLDVIATYETLIQPIRIYKDK